jgi:hypothetical protein
VEGELPIFVQPPDQPDRHPLEHRRFGLAGEDRQLLRVDVADREMRGEAEGVIEILPLKGAKTRLSAPPQRPTAN